MFTNIAVDVAESCENQGLDVARSASRVELFREYVSFLKKRFPDFIEQFFDLGGTVIALYFFDPRLSLSCLCIGVPLFFVNRLYNNRVIRLQGQLHDLREDVFRIFTKKDRREVRAYYDSTAVPQRKIANWSAVNFAMLRLFLLGIFLVVLFIAIDIDNLTTGQTYAVVAYLWTFITSTEYLPDLMESYTSLKEIQGRVRKETLPEIA
jgi:ABC-type multidrug transport system fused ATPase/permease subunit